VSLPGAPALNYSEAATPIRRGRYWIDWLREGGLRFGADAGNHRLQSVRALRREVLAQAKPLEQDRRIGCQNVARALAGTQSEQNRDQPADNMGVAVTPKREDRSAEAVGPLGGGKPDLAGATLDLIRVDMRLRRKRSERTAELDDIPIAVVPFVEQGEVVADLVDRHERTRFGVVATARQMV
jgi:hypothetical protein